MPTPAERRALLFVAAVAALGVGVRGCRALAPPDVPADARASLAAQLAAVDSAIASGGRRPSRGAGQAAPSRGRAPAPAPQVAAPRGPVDLDRAGVEELDALPGIGPALAQRIVDDRDRNGPFGSLEALQRVKGIGPAVAARLAPLVTFTGTPRPTGAASPGGRGQHP